MQIFGLWTESEVQNSDVRLVLGVKFSLQFLGKTELWAAAGMRESVLQRDIWDAVLPIKVHPMISILTCTARR